MTSEAWQKAQKEPPTLGSWKKDALAHRAIHDRRALRIFNKNSCGHCFTEDCSCEGYNDYCECFACLETLEGSYRRSWKNAVMCYRDKRTEHQFCFDEEQKCYCDWCDGTVPLRRRRYKNDRVLQ
jgi:hypothetical protein